MTRILVADADDLSSFGRDLGTGTALPAAGPNSSPLRRGDAYFHTGLGLMVWTGTAWRQGTGRHVVATEAAAVTLGTTYGALLADGYEVFCQDTKATARWDATAARFVFYDSQWQAYTPALANGASPGVPWQTVGNALINCRFYRFGRTIQCRGLVQLGSTTVFGAAGTSYIEIGYPVGYVPWQFTNVFIEAQGTGWINNQAGYAVLVAGLNPSATPANRRINLWAANNPIVTVTGTSGTYGVSSTNHAFGWNVTYETAFEA